MANKKVSLLGLVAVAVLAVVMARNANAYFDGGSEDSSGGGGGSCQDYNMGYNYCTRFKAWYYYEYDDGIDYGPVKVNADGAGINYGSFNRTTSITVGGDCDNNSSGFYVSGLILWDDRGERSINSSADDVIADPNIWTPGGGWSQHWIGVAKYDPSSSYLTKRLNINWKPSDGTHYIKRVTTVPASEVEDVWNSYGKDYAVANLPATATESDKAKASKLTEYSWFCAGDKAKKQEQNYSGEAFIRLSEKEDANLIHGTDELATCKSDGSTSKNCTKRITDGTGTKRIYYMAAGLVGKDGSKAITNGYEEFEGTKFDLYNTNVSNSSSAIAGTQKNGINGSIRDVSYHYNYDYNSSKHVAYLDLNPGDKKTICAVNDYYSHYIDGSFVDGSKQKVSACIEIEYAPIVAAIDSETSLSINGVPFVSSGVDAKKENVNYGEVNYGYHAISAEWQMTLSSSGRCSDTSFDGVSCSSFMDSSDSFKVNYMRIGLMNGAESTSLSTPDYRASVNSVTKNYDLLPGEVVSSDNAQGVRHLSGVRADGSGATQARDEESLVSFTATAKSIACGINGQEFGLNNPTNYGRMAITKNSSSVTTYGDNSNSGWSGTLWLRPNDTIKISYEACLGAQIKKDKDSGKGWDETLGDSDNITLGVNTTAGMLDNSHYASTGSAVDKDSVNGKNIVAHEVLGDTITKHLAATYQFDNASSKEARIGNLGRSISNNYEIRADGTARATINIPYNYILEPKVSSGSKEIVTLGDSNSFPISIENHDTRQNKRVQEDAYHTNVKPYTHAGYLKFAASTDSTTQAMLESLDGSFVDGDYTGDIAGALGGLDIYGAESGSIELLSDGAIKNDADKSIKVSSDKAVDGYNKLCVAVAVYPADSHNRKDEAEINDDNQSAALTDLHDGAYTRIAVSCKTVGKYPTFSIEGNGVVTSGRVKGATTTYNGRDFGSWTEYGLIANKVVSVGSGASLAYLNPQTDKNQPANSNDAGKSSSEFDSPQTLGNMDDKIGLQNPSDATVYAGQMKQFVENIKSTYFATKQTGGFLVKVNDRTYVNTDFDNDVVIDAAKAAEINSHKDEDALVFVYSAKNIIISNDVAELHVNLIADLSVDTCAEALQDSKGKNGELAEKCGNALAITGVVYSENAIALDRVFGGGSSYGSETLDPDTLVQRAEIFSYDPKIVKWGYEYKNNTQPLTTTYIEELSTRY